MLYTLIVIYQPLSYMRLTFHRWCLTVELAIWIQTFFTTSPSFCTKLLNQGWLNYSFIRITFGTNEERSHWYLDFGSKVTYASILYIPMALYHLTFKLWLKPPTLFYRSSIIHVTKNKYILNKGQQRCSFNYMWGSTYYSHVKNNLTGSFYLEGIGQYN